MIAAERVLSRAIEQGLPKATFQLRTLSVPRSKRSIARTSWVALAKGPRELEPPDVRKLARLAQIRVTDEEVADWEPKIRETIKWFDQLQKIDVEGVEPCTRSSLANLLAAREDVPIEFKNREALLENVPDREGPYVKVPKIL